MADRKLISLAWRSGAGRRAGTTRLGSKALTGTLAACCLLVTGCSDDEPSTEDVGPADVCNDSCADVDGGFDVEAEVGQDAETDVAVLPDGWFIDTLTAPVDVWIDDLGIPHIDCQTDEDCIATLGYLHARDRFAQMDIRRRVTTGRLHQLVGELAIGTDTGNRALYSSPTGEPAEEVMLRNASETTLKWLEAYADGVNAFLADVRLGRNGAVLPDEYSFPLVNLDVLPPWEPTDSLAAVLALINSLTNDSDRELALGEAYAAVPADFAADLYGPTPALVSVIQSDFEFPKLNRAPERMVSPERIAQLRTALPALRAARERVQASNVLREYEEVPDRGSNNWVLGPDMTANGSTLLSNDPHLGLSNPAIWYYAHMDAVTNGSGTIRSAGQSFAGLPWVVIGQNADIAWGATNTYFDMSDVYVETLNADGTGVMFDGGEVPFTVVDYEVRPHDAEPSTVELLFVPHHGPVLSVDEESGTAISLRWTGNTATTDGNMLTDLMVATNVEEARDALRSVTTIGQNWVVIDNSGSIGWFPYNAVPTRPWASMDLPSFLPLPGDGSAEWGEPFAYDALPQLYNPEAGYIATANNDMNGALSDGDPFNDGTSPLQVYSADGFRHTRIVDLLEATDQHTPQTMLDTVGDIYSHAGSLIAPVVVGALSVRELDAASAEVVQVLDDWDFECPTGLLGAGEDAQNDPDAAISASSAGCLAFHVLLGELIMQTFNDEREEANATRGGNVGAFTRLLLSPESMQIGAAWWDDVSTNETETSLDIMANSVAATAAWLNDEFDSQDDWRWGREHTVTLRADLFDAFRVENYNHGPFANDGGYGTVDVASPRSMGDKNFTHTSGASTRFVCEAAPGEDVACTVQLPGGNRHFRDSPNYDDLLQLWLANVPSVLQFDIGAAESEAATHIAFEPSPAE